MTNAKELKANLKACRVKRDEENKKYNCFFGDVVGFGKRYLSIDRYGKVVNVSAFVENDDGSEQFIVAANVNGEEKVVYVHNALTKNFIRYEKGMEFVKVVKGTGIPSAMATQVYRKVLDIQSVCFGEMW